MAANLDIFWGPHMVSLGWYTMIWLHVIFTSEAAFRFLQNNDDIPGYTHDGSTPTIYIQLYIYMYIYNIYIYICIYRYMYIISPCRLDLKKQWNCHNLWPTRPFSVIAIYQRSWLSHHNYSCTMCMCICIYVHMYSTCSGWMHLNAIPCRKWPTLVHLVHWFT